MVESFFERPILNSPYAYPARHWELDADGQPTNRIIDNRRRSELITPVPKPQRRRRALGQGELGLAASDGLSTEAQEYNPTPIINEIRGYVAAWRNLPNPNQWQVTPETARLLEHWRHHQFQDLRPFFCQIEAVETAIWLAEVASDRAAVGAKILDPHPWRQQGGEPRTAAHRAEACDRRRQDNSHGDADRLADGQRGAPCRQQPVLARLPGRHPRHHDQGPIARAAAERSEQLLP